MQIASVLDSDTYTYVGVCMHDNSFICRGWLHLTNMALAFTQMSSFFNTTFKVNPQCMVTVIES